jgi:hypothetical protein
MQLSSRSLAAVALLLVVEGLIVLLALGLNGGLSWRDLAEVLGLIVASAAIAWAGLRWTSR